MRLLAGVSLAVWEFPLFSSSGLFELALLLLLLSLFLLDTVLPPKLLLLLLPLGFLSVAFLGFKSLMKLLAGIDFFLGVLSFPSSPCPLPLLLLVLCLFLLDTVLPPKLLLLLLGFLYRFSIEFVTELGPVVVWYFSLSPLFCLRHGMNSMDF